MKKTLQTANGIALIITIVINYLSNTGLFNGNTMATVSARYQNLFTPAGYAFSIWGLIYLGLLGFVIYQGRGLFGGKGGEVGALDQDLALKVGWWFVVSCVANSCWVLAWLYDYTGLSVLIMLVLLFSLLKIILRTDMEMTDPPLKTIAFVWWPFCLYSGWISVALIADIAAWLTKIKWNAFSMPGSSWAIIMICVAGGIHLFMTWKRNMREFALVGAWALVAVAMANRDREASVAEAGFILAAVLVISSGIHGYRNRKFSPWRKRVLPIVFLLLAGMAGRSQEKGLSLSGKVEDPYSHKGIPGVYVSFLGMHATGIMGGTEYLDDLLLDSTDAEGRFRLQIPETVIDSFLREHGNFLSIYRFGLEARSERSGHNIFPYAGSNVIGGLFTIDTGFNYYDRNDIDRRTLILTGKNQRIKKDTSGMVVKLYRSAALKFHTAGDTGYASGKMLHVVVQELPKGGGKPLREGYLYLDSTELVKRLLIKPNTPVNVILSKWYRSGDKEDTLMVIRSLRLPPGGVKEIKVPAAF